MSRWLRSMFSRKVEQFEKELEAARSLAIAAEVLLLPIAAAGNTPEGLLANQPQFMCGYLAGFGDVLAQGAGSESGGILSQNLVLHMMINLFGHKKAEELISLTSDLMSNPTGEFRNGMRAGGEDGNRIISKGLPRSLSRHLGLP